ncbi:signal peptide-containing protein [Theileria equi strain WA]|uniref:Signal peptide-containing protein n=1 Tax=Theileria equi strain WA TaxID=1537102 RepID=L0AZD0_THEEQ|nr:signal peptide-containing protein [Theileria equi strain WA]AFZ80623.1 signal peptide-containing protein [Theileria equi strain WA]|eukprot:XP_004830289.1 signal peptide-containing protein [Theileria equi strain WA]
MNRFIAMQLPLILIFIYSVYGINIQRQSAFVYSNLPRLTLKSNGRLWMSDDSMPDDFFSNENQHYFNQDNDFSRDRQNLRGYTVNQVTILGRIGHIHDPISFNRGKCIKLSVGTSERMKNGVAFTDWHRVIVYGDRTVDYISNFANVGERVLIIGSLRYFQMNSDGADNSFRKIAEVAVNTYNDAHKIIFLSKKMRESNGQFEESFNNEGNFGMGGETENYIE